MPILSGNLVAGSEPGLIFDEDEEYPFDVSTKAFFILIEMVVQLGKSRFSF